MTGLRSIRQPTPQARNIDLFVEPTPSNAKRILKALTEFGFGGLNLTVEDFSLPNKVVQLGVPPVRIDLVTSLTGIAWEQALAGRIRGTYGEVPVYFLGRHEFLANKRSVGRQKDLADLEALGEDMLIRAEEIG